MNAGDMVIYSGKGYPTPAIVFVTRDTWQEGTPYAEPDPDHVHIAMLELSEGIWENIPESDLTPAGG